MAPNSIRGEARRGEADAVAVTVAVAVAKNRNVTYQVPWSDNEDIGAPCLVWRVIGHLLLLKLAKR